jgi:hypothetical protein
MIKALFFILAFGLASTVTVAQVSSAITDTGSVEGHLMCSDGNVPVRRATVRLIPLSSFLPTGHNAGQETSKTLESLTDFDGIYVFPTVPSGDYIVEARSPGYANDLDLVRLVIDRFSPEQKVKLLSSFPEVTVKSFGAVRKDVTIHRAGAVSGQVSVDTGGTLAQSNVEAILVSSPILGNIDSQEKSNTQTFSRQSAIDDRGEFRIAGLPPGEYRLRVRLSEAYFDALPVSTSHGTEVRMRSQRIGTAALTVYAPSAIDISDAKLIEIRDGDEISNSDIAIPLGQLHSVTGTVVKGGKVVPGARVTIQRNGHPVQPSEALSDENGSFRFDLLPAATYTLSASSSHLSGATGLTGSGTNTVLINEQNVSDVTISMID